MLKLKGEWVVYWTRNWWGMGGSGYHSKPRSPVWEDRGGGEEAPEAGLQCPELQAWPAKGPGHSCAAECTAALSSFAN